MRLFVALSISANVRESLASLLYELRRADSTPRWVNAANLHVTLKFIGHVPDEQLPKISDALLKLGTPAAISLDVRGVGFFPNDRRPAVIWAGIQARPELVTLAQRVDQALGACGIPTETRPFAPHLTLARLKEPRLSEPLRAAIAKFNDQVFGRQSSTEFHLMESKTKSSGAEYTTLHSFPFAIKGTQQ
jgi:2'-5' RNA ligase